MTVDDTGLKIATNTVVSVTKTFNLVTKNSSLGTTLMTVPLLSKRLKVRNNFLLSLVSTFLQKEMQINSGYL